MADVTFTRNDIDTLTEELGKFSQNLTQSQWNLLHAIFAAAASHVESGEDVQHGKFSGVEPEGAQKIADPARKTAAQLKNQLRRAHTRGKSFPPLPNRVSPGPIKPGNPNRVSPGPIKPGNGPRK